jgi:hyperosmotically inducible protein
MVFGGAKTMNNIRKKILTLVIALTAFSLIGSAVASGADQNTTLARKIRKELVTLPYYGVFDNLAFQIEGDTVILSGQVTRPTTRKDAERRIARIEGIERVVNNIRVLPLSSFDDSIRIRTLRAIARTGGLYRYFQGANPSIHIIVDRGRVTLEGVVSNKGDSQLAYIAANGVSGVFEVKNNLVVSRD